MPVSNFPGGFAAGVTIRGVPLTVSNPGSVFWVDSTTGSNGNRGTYDRPFATIDYAIGMCTAGKGDIIFVRPSHTEAVSAAGGIACDVSGVAIVGLGKGSLRPTITFGTADTATITVSAAGVTMHNLRIIANFADIARMINITSNGFHADSLEFTAAAANMNWIDVFDASSTTDNNADGLTITNCRAYDLDAANDSFLEINADLNRLWVEDCVCVHNNAAAEAFIEQATGKDITNAMIRNNCYQSALTAVDVLVNNDTTANSGFAINNFASHLDTAAEVLVDADGLGLFANYGSGVITASGYLLPAVDS